MGAVAGILEQPETSKSSESGLDCGPLQLTWAACGMQGWRVGMEDAHIALPVTLPRRPSAAAPWTRTALFGVLDGHGGAEVARFSSDRLPQELRKFPLVGGPESVGGDMELALKGAFHKIDELLKSGRFAADLCALANPRPGAVRAGDATMVGCTACVATVTELQVVVANAGDSRAVLCRNGRAIALSEDHKPNNVREKRRIEAAGGWVENCGPGQYRVNGNLNLSRALGDLEYKKDSWRPHEEQIICSTPDVTFTDRQPEDEFLIICCDGVWDVKSNQQVVDFVRERLPTQQDERALERVLEDLLDDCVSPDLQRTNGLGGDNMTAVLVLLKSPNHEPEVERTHLATVLHFIERSGERHAVLKADGSQGLLEAHLQVPQPVLLSDLELWVCEEKPELYVVALSQRGTIDLAQHLPAAARLQSSGPARFFPSSGRLRLELRWQIA